MGLPTDGGALPIGRVEKNEMGGTSFFLKPEEWLDLNRTKK